MSAANISQVKYSHVVLLAHGHSPPQGGRISPAHGHSPPQGGRFSPAHGHSPPQGGRILTLPVDTPPQGRDIVLAIVTVHSRRICRHCASLSMVCAIYVPLGTLPLWPWEFFKQLYSNFSYGQVATSQSPSLYISF